MNTKRLSVCVGAAAFLMSGAITVPAFADAICKGDVSVLAQPRKMGFVEFAEPTAPDGFVERTKTTTTRALMSV
jgi:hypothetical protein